MKRKQYRIIFPDRISRRAAHDLIAGLARYGNHYPYEIDVNGQPTDKRIPLEWFADEANLRSYFRDRGFDFDKVTEYTRSNWRSGIRLVENMVGSTVEFTEGVRISIVDMQTGYESVPIEGPGTISAEGYWLQFEQAYAALLRAMESLSYSELLSAYVHGVSSIESFLNRFVVSYNSWTVGPHLLDSKQNKVTLEDKFKVWIPRITGRKFALGGRNWQDFLKVQAMRDQIAIHAKNPSPGVSYPEMIKLVNLFRSGIASLLLDLHIHFLFECPAIIIRAAKSPDAILDVTEIEEGSDHPSDSSSLVK